MDANYAIKLIDEHNAVHQRKERNAIYITEALHEAVHALEKQVPRRPERAADDALVQYLDHAKCATCHSLVSMAMNYCCNCGQRIDWSGEQPT